MPHNLPYTLYKWWKCWRSATKDFIATTHSPPQAPPPVPSFTAPKFAPALFVWQSQCRSTFLWSPGPSLPPVPPSRPTLRVSSLLYGTSCSCPFTMDARASANSSPPSLWASRMKSDNCNWQESRGNAPFNQHSCWIKLHTLCVCLSPSLGISEG